ncbi:dienelactone hydrolase family protein [Nocardioides zeae]|uniref:Dienelactone hydrolase family protein n=1 Tax=Nocardioides imazamoxiresistens TaxID=3231893 RepID=A0ABU3PQC7_9ACTN|nr:dienelactone hydrolase family protein [Nocardioides zeae]MDT9591427.1 dienelactone hydrolase family protein [Nocardioides zeae]
MTTVVLFHHALGRTEGVLALGRRLAAAGHEVHTPDLFDGAVFDTVERGVGHAEAIGFDAILQRATVAVDGLPDGVVHAGLSLGVMPAQLLAQTRRGARGAVLLEACVPPSEFGGSWPAGLPLQVHGMTGDPFFGGEGDLDVARALAAQEPAAEVFTYDGDAHLFTDSSQPGHDAAATDLVVERVLAFLERVG